jgi:hypothetical protein
MVQGHHDLGGDDGADHRRGESIRFDVIVGEEELLQRQDYAEAAEKVESDEADGLNLAPYHGAPIRRPAHRQSWCESTALATRKLTLAQTAKEVPRSTRPMDARDIS